MHLVAHRYDALDYDGDQQLDKAELVSRLAKLESGSDSGGTSNGAPSLVLSDPELDALIAAADLGSGWGARGGGGGFGSGDGMVSRQEWRCLVQGRCNPSNDKEGNLDDIRRDGSGENGCSDLARSCDDDIDAMNSREGQRNEVVKPVTSSMFRAFALRDLRCDLSSEELELCFARVCVLSDNSSNSNVGYGEVRDGFGGGEGGTARSKSSSTNVSPAAMKGSLATLGEKGSAAVDRAMEIDFGRYNQFLKLLRAKVKVD